MKRLIAAIWLFLTAVASSTSGIAQEIDSDWPPDPAMIFAQGVEVVEIDVKPFADNNERHIHVYDHAAARWLEFPYSQDLTDVTYIYQLDDGNVFFLDSVQPEGQLRRESTTWILDPETGDISLPFDNPCGNQNREFLNSFYLPWSYYQNAEINQMHLCSVETGELSPPLPDDVSWIWPSDPMDLNVVVLSPNGKWVIALGWPQGENSPHVYAYEITTNVLNDLGSILYPHFGIRWITDTRIIVSSSEMPEWWPIQLFAGDVTQPNSLVYAIGHVRYEPLYYDDPPRYEVVPGLNGSRVFLEDCVLQVYDLETQTFNEYALGNLCDYGIILPSGDGARLYRELNPDRATPATLVRFNPSTGEREDLLTGEIEWLESVSPNGRYAVLVMDSNGQIEGLPNGIGADPQFERVMTPYLVLYDLAAQRIVYKTSTEWNQYPWEMAVRRLHESTLDVTDRGRFIHGDLGPTSRLVWLRDDVFWLRRLMSSEGGVDVFEDTVLHLADGQVIEKPIGEVVAVFSNRERLLVRANDGRTSSAVNMYDVETGEMSQFINGMDQYIVQIEVTKDDRIAVDIRLREQPPDLTLLSAHYEVRILGR